MMSFSKLTIKVASMLTIIEVDLGLVMKPRMIIKALKEVDYEFASAKAEQGLT